MSDDGEPHGTAGPDAERAASPGVGEVAAVVTRYFGGTLLGKGARPRVHVGVTTALAALPNEAPRRDGAWRWSWSTPTSTRCAGRCPREATVLGEEYATTVGYRIELPAERVAGAEANGARPHRGDVLFEGHRGPVTRGDEARSASQHPGASNARSLYPRPG